MLIVAKDFLLELDLDASVIIVGLLNVHSLKIGGLIFTNFGEDRVRQGFNHLFTYRTLSIHKMPSAQTINLVLGVIVIIGVFIGFAKAFFPSGIPKEDQKPLAIAYAGAIIIYLWMLTTTP